MALTRFWVCMHCNFDLGDMTFGQGHNKPLGHGQQLCEILSRSNLAVRSYGPDTDFRYVSTVTLTKEIWPVVKVMTHPWFIDNNCVKYYPDPTWQWRVMVRTRILGLWALWPWPRRYDLGSRSWHILELLTTRQCHDTPFGHGHQLCEIFSRSNLTMRSLHTLGSLTTIVWNIQIGQVVIKLWPGHDVNRRTDRRTGWFLYIPKVCLRGYN